MLSSMGDFQTGALVDEMTHRYSDLVDRTLRSNPALEPARVHECVRRLLVQTMFLRFCESRGLDTKQLRCSLASFQREPEAPLAMDVVTQRASGDRQDDPAWPSPFSALSADILGRVYEQFLRNGVSFGTARRGDGRKVEGAYYTPAHIVRFVVEQTVGRLLEGLTPQQATEQPETHQPLAILDPACGSGAFLLGAYQVLLDWYRNHYAENALRKDFAGARPRLSVDRRGRVRLSLYERTRILQTHLYGVDRDPLAVEVARYSLVLKMLEDEPKDASPQPSQRLVADTLSALESNIRCGNSLLGADFYQGRLNARCPADGDRNNYAFDWATTYPAILSSGGFDAVIGNPPYLSYSGRQRVPLDPNERAYLEQRYDCSGWCTAHGLFVQLAVTRLARGFVSFVVPDQIGHLNGYAAVRRALCSHAHLVAVRYWGEGVFQGVVTPALTFVASKKGGGTTVIERADGTHGNTTIVGSAPWVLPSQPAFVARIRAGTSSLGALVADPGVHTGNCAARLVRPRAQAGPQCVPLLEGKQVHRYRCDPPGKLLDLGYQPRDGEYYTIREQTRYEQARFVIRQTAPYPIVGPRDHAVYFRNSLLALYEPNTEVDVRYLVALLNSRLLRFVYTQSVQESRQKAFPQVKVATLRALPIRLPDFTRPQEKSAHDALVGLVQRLLDLHRHRQVTASPNEHADLQRRIAAADRQIDRLVYKIYGLSPAEIAQVEQATSP